MKLKVHISTCPNDTFMFDGMLHHRVDTEGLQFKLHLADIEELNNAAREGIADITKLSYAAYPLVKDKYCLLSSGSALGRGNGPLLVSKEPLDKKNLTGKTIAIPGRYTTANMLLKTLFPETGETREYLFSDIADAVLAGEVDAGLLIHEGRFTYADKGLSLVADTGREWESKYSLPLPLGAIAISRNLPPDLSKKINRVLRRSVEYAFKNPQDSYPFVKRYARELGDNVINQHITLFVNEYSLDIGEDGRLAVERLLESEMGGGKPDFIFG